MAGSTRFGNINQKSEKCEIGWTWYGAQFQGTGLNKATKYELLNFGFETLGFRRIQLSADLENIRSQKAIEKLGAQREGVFRNNYIDSNGISEGLAQHATKPTQYIPEVRDDYWKKSSHPLTTIVNGSFSNSATKNSPLWVQMKIYSFIILSLILAIIINQ